ncbi:hypothetical protein [Chlamydia abortus]|uniref:Uncharacterized protein n=1 Tax=Chlamydia abortus (strain DSM 27085 / S26/3) TaxID=218497 RepID=Q5L6Y2_CHLAB|nr:hypothetical protein [Chlamydia abortus]ASD30320.1 hypothetical protein CEF07_00710 [Chlamydia abortus]AUS59560.1 uncharacterized protein CHAB577_0139 [Chlamydia abortus]EGK68910.1 hypothetical protein CAB1_0138 [Chlamydia abortus LLG]QEM73516.1 hypothetical protein DZK34_00710 [Chlamydia abortus]QRR31846.1 hypothetical protein JS522_00700 [Chlamydia abortus]
MLIRLFFGIPLSKGLENIHEYPLTVAIFQKKEYLGIYSPAQASLPVAQLPTYYQQAQEILEKVLPEKYLSGGETSLLVFPDILIGK